MSRIESSDANESDRGSAWLIPGRLGATQNQVAMKLGLASARVRYRATLRAILTLAFTLQVVGLCLCFPVATDEHDCCPPTKQGLNAAGASARAATSCCPDGVGMQASVLAGEADVKATQKIHAAVAHAWLARNEVPAQPHHTGSAPVGRTSLLLRSPILRI